MALPATSRRHTGSRGEKGHRRNKITNGVAFTAAYPYLRTRAWRESSASRPIRIERRGSERSSAEHAACSAAADIHHGQPAPEAGTVRNIPISGAKHINTTTS